ncbi:MULTISPECIES: spore cortex biosynthesis protein YabQ [unclassified Dehalobacter]|uniref:spore cortex biosynthesis protein YabQ n=1 Tax=unclassified Dehalobacter TaxID=2635733 RepID=UPI00055171EC|nr:MULTISPECIES: spore cortex biosynthesis protein YabQ [unclassified Dehalobacter]
MISIVLSGLLVGICFDFYRMLRWHLGLTKIQTFLGDLLFSIAALGIIFCLAQKANYLEFRFYLFLGSLLGLLLYIVIFSRYVKKIFDVLFRLIRYVSQFIRKLIQAFLRGVYIGIAGMMRIPYGILRWLGMLLYRIGEAISRNTLIKKSK